MAVDSGGHGDRASYVQKMAFDLVHFDNNWFLKEKWNPFRHSIRMEMRE